MLKMREAPPGFLSRTPPPLFPFRNRSKIFLLTSHRHSWLTIYSSCGAISRRRPDGRRFCFVDLWQARRKPNVASHRFSLAKLM